MAHIIQARFVGDILEPAPAQIFKQMIAVPDSGDKEVRVAVVINVSERGGDTDLIGESDSGFGGNVLELTMPEVSPELAGTQLGDEVDIIKPITIDVRDRDAIAMIVMGWLPV